MLQVYDLSAMKSCSTFPSMEDWNQNVEIIEFWDLDPIDNARLYLEKENLNETILLPSLTIVRRRIHDRQSVMGKNALFTNIYDIKPEELLDLYRKMNRVEHSPRTISMRDLASPVYR